MLDMQDDHTQISLKENHESADGTNLNINWGDGYVPKDIPDGYTISSLAEDKNLKVIQYSNPDGSMIIFQQWNEGSTVNIDTEDANEISKVTVQGTEGMLVVKGDVVTVTWSDTSHIFLLKIYKGGLSNEKVLNIAESVVQIK